tara:strand:+ start:1956 stop:2408 length:453 start_codon:yes stop_codon:yes gene_type:complete
MIVEYAQLLSTAHHVCDGEPTIQCYKATHKNHPSAVWARANKYNYDWLHSLLVATAKEYTYRYKKIHATESGGIINNLSNLPVAMSQATSLNEFRTDIPQCMPIEYKKSDAISAYRLYYIKDKERFARWKERKAPSWFTEGVHEKYFVSI